MPAFQINDDEREAMRGLPHLSRLIYVFGLRPFMDYSTGVVGVKRGVSWKSIAEELHIEPHQGIKGGDPTEKELRRALVWLEKAGLIGPNQAERRLVFPLLLATQDNSARNKVGIKWADEAGRPETPHNPNESGASEHEDHAKVAGGEMPKVGTPPVSGKSTSTGNARGAFAMPLEDWAPEPKTFKAFAFANSVPVSSLTPEILAAFRTYWHVRPTTEKTQAQWEQQLVSHLQYQLRQAQAGGNTYANSRTGTGSASGPGQQRRSSVVDRVEANVAAQRAARGEYPEAAEPWLAGETLDHDDPDLWPQMDQQLR